MVSQKIAVAVFLFTMYASAEGIWRTRFCRDCRMGFWTPWSACSASTCGQHGYKTRSKPVKHQATCGKPCSILRQRVYCVKICNTKDPKCAELSGHCVNTNNCTGGFVPGLCCGPRNRQCCIPRSECTVRRYSSPYFVGDPVYIEDDFRRRMDTLGSLARTCVVKVYVNHSWRKLASVIGGAIVSPASKTHLIGHAIDMNLMHGAYYCNTACMRSNVVKSGSNPYKCFLRNVTSSGLRWGGSWQGEDPAHIDDWYDRAFPEVYQTLRTKLQAACKHVSMT